MSISVRAVRRKTAPRIRHALAAAFVLASWPAVSFAHEFKLGDIEIRHPWSRATPPGARTGAGYLELVNDGAQADRLTGARSPAGTKVEIHETSTDGGTMRMRLLSDGVEVPGGGDVALKPGGVHLMLIGLKAPFKAGDRVPLTLSFERSGDVDVTLAVEAMGTTPSHEDMTGH